MKKNLKRVMSTLLSAVMVLSLAAPALAEKEVVAGGYEIDMDDLPKVHFAEHPEWERLYNAAWEIHKGNIKKIPAATNPEEPYYVDEAFSGNIFVWDTMFMMMFDKYGIHQFPTLPSIDNFYWNQTDSDGPDDGYICREITESTGKPYWNGYDDITATNPPLFAWAEWEQYKVHGDKERFNQVIRGKTIYERLVSHYNFIEREKKMASGLYGKTNGYGNGLDNTPNQDGGHLILDSSIGGKQTYNDLSIQQAQFAYYLSLIANELGRDADAAFYESEHQRIADLINEKLWNETDDFYYNLDADGVTQTGVATPTGLWALAGRVASQEQAEAMVARYGRNSEKMFRPNGLSTVTYDWPTFNPNGGYWLGSFWAPTSYQYIKGLHEYGMDDVAFEEAVRHVDALSDVYEAGAGGSHTLWENYSTEYTKNGSPSRGNFVGWTGALAIGCLIEDIAGVTMKASQDVINWNINLTEEHGISNLWMQNAAGEVNRVSLSAGKRVSRSSPVDITVSCDRAFTLNVTHGDIKQTIEVTAGEHRYTIGGQDGSEAYLDAAVRTFRADDASLSKAQADQNALDYVTFAGREDESITDGLKNQSGKGTGLIRNVNTIGYRPNDNQNPMLLRNSPIMNQLGYTGAKEAVKNGHQDGQEGFMAMVPAANRMQTMKLIVGVQNTTASLTLGLSDASQQRVVRTLSGGGAEQVYTVEVPYRASSDGRYLMAEFVNNTSGGQISLKGILLEDGGAVIPKAPQNLTVSSSDGALAVSADKPDAQEYDSYRIYIGADGGELSRMVSADTLPFTIDGLENFKSYRVAVSGVRDGAESSMSEVVNGIPEPAGCTDNDRARIDLDLAIGDILNGNASFDAVTGPLNTAVAGPLYGSEIRFSSSAAGMSIGIMNSGMVIRPVRPQNDKAVTLTLEALFGSGSAHHTENAVVPAIDTKTEAYVQGSGYREPWQALNLTDIGSKDWIQFPTASETEYAKKQGEAYITNFHRFDSVRNENATDAPITFAAADAGSIKPVNNRAIVSKGLGSGFEFQVPYSETTQNLRVYGGVWSAEGQLDFMVNGRVLYSDTVENRSGMSMRVFDIKYQLASPDDVATVRFTTTQSHNPSLLGSLLISAITLSDTGDSIFRDIDVLNPTRIEAEDFTRMSGIAANPENCGEGGYNIGSLNAGEWLTKQINVKQGGIYSFQFRVAAANEADAGIDILIDDQKVGALDNQKLHTGGWQSWQTTPAVHVNLPAGRHTLKLAYTKGGSNLNWYEIAPVAVSDTSIVEVLHPDMQVVDVGTAFESLSRPETVLAKLDTGDTIPLPVSWNPDGYDSAKPGIYSLTGELTVGEPFTNPLGLTASLPVTVSKIVEIGADAGHVKATDWTTAAEGVRAESCSDEGGGTNTSGTVAGKWLTYHIDVAANGFYDFTARVADRDQGLSFDILIDGEKAGELTHPTGTGGWQAWETTAPVRVKLPAGLHELKIAITGGGMNLNWFGIQLADPILDITEIVQPDEQIVAYGTPYVALNLPDTLKVRLSDGSQTDAAVTWDPYAYEDTVIGAQTIPGVIETSETIINPLGLKAEAKVTVVRAHTVSSDGMNKVEAEDWTAKSDRVTTEACSDEGGGRNTSWTVAGQWMTYHIDVEKAGVYLVTGRVADRDQGITFDVLIDGEKAGTVIQASGTGGWQTWATTPASKIVLPAGLHEFKIDITAGGMNINWFGLTRYQPDLSLQSEIYRIDDENSIVSGIPSGTSAADVLSSLRCKEEGSSIQLADADGNPLAPEAAVQTGMKVQALYAGEVGREYELSVLGDLGVSETPGIQELLLIKRHILGRDPLTPLQTASADMNGDGIINIFDLVELKFMILRG